MKISSARIENFRSITRLDFENFPNFVTITGPNNAGKSNILKAFNLLFNNKISQTEVYAWERDIPYWSQETKKQTIIEAWMQLNTRDHDYLIGHLDDTFEIETTTKAPRASEKLKLRVKSSFSKTNTRNDPVSWQGLVKTGETGTEIFERVLRRLRFIYLPANVDIKYFLEESYGELNRYIKDTWGLTSERADLIRKLKTAEGDYLEKVEDAVASFQAELLGYFNRIERGYDLTMTVPREYLGKLPIELILQDGVSETPITSKGAGLQNISTILLNYFLASKRSTYSRPYKAFSLFAIEEPETSLHVKLQKIFAVILRALSENNQTFITTHSSFMLNDTDLSGNILVETYSQGDKKGTFIPEDSGTLFAYFAALGEPTREVEVVKEIKKDSKLLITEGECEYLYFSSMVKGSRFKESLNPEITVFDAGGKDQIKKKVLYRALKKLGVKFVIVFDGDRENEIRGALEEEGLEENKEFIVLKPATKERNRWNLEGLFDFELFGRFKSEKEFREISIPEKGQLVLNILCHDKVEKLDRYKSRVKTEFHKYVIETANDEELRNIYDIINKINVLLK